MDRNFYYVGIAFFGMINGLFNQALVPFAYLFATVLAPGLLFGNESLTLLFASLMASTGTIIAAGKLLDRVEPNVLDWNLAARAAFDSWLAKLAASVRGG